MTVIIISTRCFDLFEKQKMKHMQQALEILKKSPSQAQQQI